MNFKDLLRETLLFLRLDLTKNLEYDRLTRLIMQRVIHSRSNCIDVGCHKGEILQQILTYAPDGQHYAFEPIPYFFKQLQATYPRRVTLYPYALADQAGTSSFQFVKNAPAYSGIRRRHYAVAQPDIEEIEVEIATLDDLIPADVPIHFMKIDVEGGEFAVLKGGKKLLKRHKPVVVFECGLGASDYYGTDPLELYTFLTREVGLKLATLKAFVQSKEALSPEAFKNYFHNNQEYYFIAFP
ncbi:methyltransferase, FkbM family [Catalinimonas alkaloidigena]|uniref:Methyltransferase, FkbM family n=1 Tax=Catalinimonas alkaloidigena TaxID=1075417 RepID=A0A1G9ISE3_9BACT|nr:FkbM family methyltransferase [Catalinimonas alkaloidigena]SDL27965.1 methyltransferase, FkbM family [Catalinimonas alkaloidigena]